MVKTNILGNSTTAKFKFHIEAIEHLSSARMNFSVYADSKTQASRMVRRHGYEITDGATVASAAVIL